MAAIGTLNLAMRASLLHAVPHLAMTAWFSSGPLPWTTSRSLRHFVKPSSCPANARMAAVSSGVLPMTPVLVKLTLRLMVCIASAVRPASDAKPIAASPPCTKAVQSSAQVLTDGWD